MKQKAFKMSKEITEKKLLAIDVVEQIYCCKCFSEQEKEECTYLFGADVVDVEAKISRIREEDILKVYFIEDKDRIASYSYRRPITLTTLREVIEMRERPYNEVLELTYSLPYSNGESCEKICVRPDFIDSKFSYIQENYNEDLTMKHNPLVRIKSFGFVVEEDHYFL